MLVFCFRFGDQLQAVPSEEAAPLRGLAIGQLSQNTRGFA